MAAKPLPDQALLLKLLRYEPETGKLFWRQRAQDFFQSGNGEAICRMWNTRFSDREAFTANARGYRQGHVLGVHFFAHRLIWRMVTGEDLGSDDIDHENGIRSDNRWRNLRRVTPTGNRMNCGLSRRSQSGVTGVGRRDDKWRAHITVHGRQISLGTWSDFNKAVAARKAAERAYGFHPNHGQPRSCSKSRSRG